MCLGFKETYFSQKENVYQNIAALPKIWVGISYALFNVLRKMFSQSADVI